MGIPLRRHPKLRRGCELARPASVHVDESSPPGSYGLELMVERGTGCGPMACCSMSGILISMSPSTISLSRALGTCCEHSALSMD